MKNKGTIKFSGAPVLFNFNPGKTHCLSGSLEDDLPIATSNVNQLENQAGHFYATTNNSVYKLDIDLTEFNFLCLDLQRALAEQDEMNRPVSNGSWESAEGTELADLEVGVIPRSESGLSPR